MKRIPWFLKLLLIMVIAFAAARLLMTQVLGNNQVSGDSMQPTLENNDRLLSLRHAKIARNKIVVIKAPDAPAGTLYIKRVIGMPGDTVRVKNERLYINGKQQAQPYLKPSFMRQEIQAWAMLNHKEGSNKPFTNDFDLKSNPATHSTRVPAGKYFVMGDNRFVSHDGRAFGFISRAQIESVVVWRYWPLNQMHTY
ncbi:signal peptidase I [Lacticaseibacillus sp. GG6-2]